LERTISLSSLDNCLILNSSFDASILSATFWDQTSVTGRLAFVYFAQVLEKLWSEILLSTSFVMPV